MAEDEIKEISRQFNQGTGEWKQFIKSIKINNIHGWNNQEILFNFPVVAIVGQNGIGKSTFLKAAVCAYDNNDAPNFYPSKMFISTQWDAAGMNSATIEYRIRHGDFEKHLTWRKTNDWGFTPKKSKPQRKVFFLDISRTLPLDATAGYAKIAKIANEEMKNRIELDEESIKNLSYILGQNYDSGRFVGNPVNVSREVGLLTRDCGEISQFHQGAGEDTMLDMFKLMQTIPPQSLLVIDEVENSLHPQAQRRFIRYLLKLARKKKIQIILSTHSPFVLEELPSIARIMLIKLSDRKDIMYGVSSQFALSTIDEEFHPELFVFLEDEEARLLFWEILKNGSDRYDELCKKISASAVGSCSVIDTLNSLARKQLLPYRSLAIIDGDKREEYKNCLSLPGNLAPEKQIITDLKGIGWKNLDERFGVGAGSLYKCFDDATLIPNHHEWMEYIGDHIKKSKDVVWSILIEEWCKQCLNPDDAAKFIESVHNALPSE